MADRGGGERVLPSSSVLEDINLLSTVDESMPSYQMNGFDPSQLFECYVVFKSKGIYIVCRLHLLRHNTFLFIGVGFFCLFRVL